MNKRTTYMNKINTLGQISSIIVLIGMFMIPIGTAFYFGIEFNIMDTLAASTSLIALFLPTAVIENISYNTTQNIYTSIHIKNRYMAGIISSL